jgi:hypothetical protein
MKHNYLIYYAHSQFVSNSNQKETIIYIFHFFILASGGERMEEKRNRKYAINIINYFNHNTNYNEILLNVSLGNNIFKN